jgi:hypothetical protein
MRLVGFEREARGVFDGVCQPTQPPNAAGQICIVDANGSNLRTLTVFPFESSDASWSRR